MLTGNSAICRAMALGQYSFYFLIIDRLVDQLYSTRASRIVDRLVLKMESQIEKTLNEKSN